MNYEPEEKVFMKAQTSDKLHLRSKKQNWIWIAMIIFVIILSGIGMKSYFTQNKQNENLGTFDDPEVAFRETQKALLLLSDNLSTGIESVKYVKEYNKSKNLIFKENKPQQ